MIVKLLLKIIFIFILVTKINGICEQNTYYKTNTCYSFSEYKDKKCCCNYGYLYEGEKCKVLENKDKNNEYANKCSEDIIQKFITDFSNSKNLCDFCKNGVQWLKLNANICSAISGDKSDLSLPKATSDFLNDFVKSGGSCDTVCDCIEPKPISCPLIGKCCDGCVCAENIVGDGIDGYTATLKEGCTWPQFWDDWSKQTTTKCTTKTFN